ncbi:hypothetical protein [Pararhodobacter sp. CCB-MM2]|uniref:hypothetical protein n=1 Tax=Pararhodobacter sp. CCB-MM2 TaxID=1786003 RepID=UPI00082F8838|nr:hypothetical protein [Pararhodobacter sp. CCB-MM2]
MNNQTPQKVDFEVTIARQINGAWCEAGTRVSLFPAQAKYYLPPFGTGLKAVAVKVAGKVEKAPAKPAE